MGAARKPTVVRGPNAGPELHIAPEGEKAQLPPETAPAGKPELRILGASDNAPEPQSALELPSAAEPATTPQAQVGGKRRPARNGKPRWSGKSEPTRPSRRNVAAAEIAPTTERAPQLSDLAPPPSAPQVASAPESPMAAQPASALELEGAPQPALAPEAAAGVEPEARTDETMPEGPVMQALVAPEPPIPRTSFRQRFRYMRAELDEIQNRRAKERRRRSLRRLFRSRERITGALAVVAAVLFIILLLQL